MRFSTTAQLARRYRRAACGAALGAVFAWPAGAAPAPSPVQLCLVPASAQMSGMNSEDAIAAVGEVFARYLAGPKVRLESLTARLEAADGALVSEKTEKRKASSDGEDLLTPLVVHASEIIVGAVSGAQP
jgi:hypothetical protein